MGGDKRRHASNVMAIGDIFRPVSYVVTMTAVLRSSPVVFPAECYGDALTMAISAFSVSN